MENNTTVGSVFFSLKTSNRKSFFNEIKSAASGAESVFASSMKSVTKFIGAAFSVASVVSFGKKCVEVASETQSAWQGLSSILNGQNKSFSQAEGFIKSYIKDGLVPLNNAVTAYKNLAARGYDTSQIQSVMTALKDSAAYGRQASYSYGEAVQTATEGLKNENSVLVDNAGVTKNVAKMWDEYAKSIGTTRDKLTQQQKITAEVNGILSETKWQTGDAARYAGSFAGKIASLSASFTTLKTNIGNLIIPLANFFIPYVQSAMNAINSLALSIKSLLASFGVDFFDASSLGNFSTGAVDAAQNMTDLGNATQAASKKAEKARKAFAAYDEINILSKPTSTDSSAPSSSSSTTQAASSSVGSVTQQLTDKIKALNDIDLGPLKTSFENLKNSISNLAAVIKDSLMWAWENVLKPLGKWTIEKALPVTIALLSSAIDLLTAVIKKLQPYGIWLWDNFLQPISKWVGDKFISALSSVTSVIKGLTDVINGDTSVKDFISTLSTGQTVFISVATAIGIVVGAVSAAKVAFSAFKAISTVVTSALTFLASPIGLVIAGITALIAVIILCVKHWDQIKSAAGIALDWIKAKWGTIASWFSNNVTNPIKNAWNAVLDHLKPLINEITGAFKEAWKVIKLVWNTVSPFFKGVWEQIKSVFSVVGIVLSTQFKNAWELIKLIWNVAVSYFQTIWNNIKAIFSFVGTFFKGAFETAWTAIKAIWNNATAYFTLIWAGIKAVFAVVKGVLSGDFSDAWKAIANVWDKAKSYFQTKLDGIKSVFGSIGKWFSSTFSSAWQSIKSVFSGWSNFFKGLVDSVKDTFKNIGKNIANAISASVTSAINGVISTIEGTINTGINMINGAVKLINNIPGVNIGTFNKLSLPRLAQGGYVAANNPRLAIIGDNRREGEIVTPESKIREQVKLAFDELGVFARNTVQKIKLDLELLVKYPDGRIIAKQINEAQLEEGRILIQV